MSSRGRPIPIPLYPAGSWRKFLSLAAATDYRREHRAKKESLSLASTGRSTISLLIPYAASPKVWRHPDFHPPLGLSCALLDARIARKTKRTLARASVLFSEGFGMRASDAGFLACEIFHFWTNL